MEVASAQNPAKTSTPNKRSRKPEPPEITPQRRYSVEIIKAGALLPDTRIMLAHWDMNADVPANLARMQEENVFGKTSRARLPGMLALFRKRYLTNPETLATLVALTHDDAPYSLLDPLLYLLAARADPLLFDSATLFLAPLHSQGQPIVTTDDLARWLSAQSAAGRTLGKWSPDTVTRLAQGLLSALRDFGALEGKVIKRLAPRYLSIRAFALLAFYLSREYTTGERLLHADEWRLFFLDQAVVEKRFLEAHQERLLVFQAAGRVIRVDFPLPTLEEYAHALAQGTL